MSKPERLEARLSKEQKELLQRAADLKGTTLTDFVLTSAHEAAVATLHSFNVLKLSERDRKEFVSALLNPPMPNKTLRQAAERYRQRTGR